MTEITQKQVVVFLGIIITVLSLIYLSNYTKMGPTLSGGSISDDSRFTRGANFILRTKYIDRAPLTQVSDIYFTFFRDVPPGYYLLIAITKSLTFLDPIKIFVLFHFFCLLFSVISLYVLSHYLFENKFIGVLSVLLFTGYLGDQTHVFTIFFAASFGVLLLYTLHKALFERKKYFFLSIIIYSCIFCFHNSSTLILSWIILLFGIVTFLVYKKNSIPKVMMIIFVFGFSSLFSYMLWWSGAVVSLKEIIVMPLMNLLTKMFFTLNIVLFIPLIFFFVLIYLYIKRNYHQFKRYFLKYTNIIIVIYFLGVLFFVIWLFQKSVDSGGFILFYMNLKTTDLTFYLLLSIGIPSLILVPLGLWQLIGYKILSAKKILIYCIFFVTLGPIFFKWLTFIGGKPRIVKYFSMVCAIIGSLGLYYLYEKLEKRKLIIMLVFFLVILGSFYHTAQYVYNNNNKLHAVKQDDVNIYTAVRWLDLHLDEEENIIGDRQSAMMIDKVTLRRAVDNIVRPEDRIGQAISAEMLKSFTSQNPYTIVPLLTKYKAKYFIMNKEVMKNYLRAINIFFNQNRGEGYNSEIYSDYILTKMKKHYNVSEEQAAIQELYNSWQQKIIYDDCSTLNKVYSNGQTNIYELNSLHVPKKKITLPKINNKSEIKILNMGLPDVIYLGTVGNVSLEISNQQNKSKDINLSITYLDPLGEVEKEESYELNIKNNEVIKKQFPLKISKYAFEGNYFVLFNLYDTNKTYDFKQKDIFFRESPLTIVYNLLNSLRPANEYIYFADAIIQNKLNNSENVTLNLELISLGDKQILERNITLAPNETRRELFHTTFKEPGIYEAMITLKSKYSTLNYNYSDIINVTEGDES